jgi:hypothetical protein
MMSQTANELRAALVLLRNRIEWAKAASANDSATALSQLAQLSCELSCNDHMLRIEVAPDCTELSELVSDYRECLERLQEALQLLQTRLMSLRSRLQSER